MCFCLVFFNIIFRFNNNKNNHFYLYSAFEDLYKVALQEIEKYHTARQLIQNNTEHTEHLIYSFIYFISR